MPLTNEDILKLRAWMRANPMEEPDSSESESESDYSESDSDDPVPVLGEQLPYRMTIPYSGRRPGMTNTMSKIFEKIRLGQRSDASPPGSAPKLEQSGEVAPEPPAAAEEQAEQIVPPQAPMLRRRCDRPGRKNQ